MKKRKIKRAEEAKIEKAGIKDTLNQGLILDPVQTLIPGGLVQDRDQGLITEMEANLQTIQSSI